MAWSAPAFWSRRGLAAGLLAPAGRLYGAAAAARLRRPPRHRPGIAVVVVGNFVMGGAGKTPVTLHLADLARGRGRAAVIVMRGYGGSLAGPLRVDPSRHDAAAVGDEALLAARRGHAVVVARDRAAGAAFAEAAGADLLLLDDGFQSPAVARDAAIVVVDAGQGVGNGRCFPAGPLRAPLAVQMAAADRLVVVGDDATAAIAALAATGAALPPISRARLVAADPAAFAGRRWLAFAGIGRPAKFAETLTALGADLVDCVGFADHHRFTPAEARRLLARAAAAGAGLVTTEKDRVRIGAPTAGPLAELAAAVATLAVDLVVEDDALAAMLDRLASRR